jgi:hypothetical protein
MNTATSVAGEAWLAYQISSQAEAVRITASSPYRAGLTRGKSRCNTLLLTRSRDELENLAAQQQAVVGRLTKRLDRTIPSRQGASSGFAF